MAEDTLDSPIEVTEDGDVSVRSDSTPLKADAEMVVAAYPPLREYFGIDGALTEEKDNLGVIWDYYAPKVETVGQLLSMVRAAERKMSPPQVGESRTGHLASYIKVLKGVESAVQELGAYSA